MLKMRGIRSLLAELALNFPENENSELIKKYATRALAIFGENEIVRQAINRRPIVGKVCESYVWTEEGCAVFVRWKC